MTSFKDLSPHIEVQTVMDPDGEVKVEVAWPPAKASRWFRPKPLYLHRKEARDLANQLLTASGHDLLGVLDDEDMRLRKAMADPELSYADRSQLETCQAMVALVRRLVVEGPG